MNTASVKEDGSLEGLVGRVADEFLARVERGERPDIEEYVGRHPEAAGLLRNVLAALQLFDQSQTGPNGSVGEAAHQEVHGTLGDFRILREVGRGGMGVVYEAEQISLGRRVALKVLPFASTLDTKQLQRFKNEAQAAAHLHHQNIVPVHATGCERGVHFYAMQFIEGHTLAQVIADLRLQNADLKEIADCRLQIADLQKEGAAHAQAPARSNSSNLQSTICNLKSSTLPSTHGRAFYHAIARLGIQAADALDYSHELGIIHRDVKPANMLVDGRGKLWITDFGLAHCQSHAGLTMSGDLIGTLRYMSPDQALAKRVLVDHRTDIYSLGATLYELLTGRPVFDGADRQELLRQIAFEEPKPLRRHKPAIPVELGTIVLKALEKNPADRYATAKELAEDLERFTKDEPIRARRPSLRRLARGWCRRHRTLVVAILAIMLTSLLLAGAALWRHELQSAGMARAVNDDLGETVRLLGQERWADAQKLLERAQARLEGTGPGPLRDELEKRQRELKLVDQLDKARWQAVSVSWREFQDHVRADRAYHSAFANNGLDVTTLTQQEAVRRINASAITSHLVRALDDWAFHKDHLPEGGESLRAIAQLVDENSWRQKLRDRQFRKDGAALVELAAKDAVLDQPPENLLHLAILLLDVSAADAALTLFLKAQRVYPADFWINYELARLLGDDPARATEAVAFGRAALALRPESPVVYLNLANAVGHQGLDKEPEAEALCRKAIALQPDYAVAYIHLANNQLNRKKFPEAEAAFRTAVRLQPTGDILVQLAEFLREIQHKPSEAAEVFRKAVAIFEQELVNTKTQFGSDHLETLRAMNKLAMYYGNDLVGRLKEAIALNEQIFEKRKGKLGPDHKDTLTSMNNLAFDYGNAGRLPEAIALFEQMAAIEKTKLGSDHPDTLAGMSNLAFLYAKAGRLLDAIALNQETLEKRKTKLGPAHENTLVSMNNLAHVYIRAGRSHEAIAVLEQLLEKRKVQVGPDHANTLQTMSNLARAYFSADQMEKAIALGEELVKKAKAKLGPDHPETVARTEDLWRFYDKVGKFDEATRVLSSLLERARQKDEPQTVGAVLASLGLNLLNQQRYPDAEPVLRECLAIRQKHLPDDWSTYNAQSLLGEALLGQKRYAEAETFLVGAYEGLKARPGEIHQRGKAIREAVGRLPRLYDAWGNKEEADNWRDELESGFIRTWLVLSEPIAYAGFDGAKALDQEQLPREALCRPQVGDRIQVGGKTVMWKEHKTTQAYIDFKALYGFPYEHRVTYAACYVHADKDVACVLSMGSDDQAKVYLNGQEVLQEPRAVMLLIDAHKAPIALRKGSNLLFFKVVNQGLWWEGSVRIRGVNGRPLEGVEFRLTP